MNKYRIYCTEKQTKKALELGAPIEYAKVIDTINGNSIRIPEETGEFYLIPTAEEMLGWLEEQEGITNIVIAKPSKWVFLIYNETYYHSTGEGFNSRKEATLDAIDAALEYLISKKGE